MTTYILCGGSDRKYENFGKNLAKVITDIVEKPHILDVFFSRPAETWDKDFADWQKFYIENFDDIKCENANRENFYEQVNRADVIFFHGGWTRILTKNLAEFKDWAQLIIGQNKIIVGSSAGANILAAHSVGRIDDEIRDGLGILPLNVVVHYESDDRDHVRTHKSAVELARQFPDFPTVMIREGEFAIFQGE